MESVKLEKHDAFMLLKSILKHWTIKEHCLEYEADITDELLNQIGYPLFLAALEWNGGMDYEQASEWYHTKVVQDEVTTFTENCVDADDFLADHVQSISIVILDLTKSVIQPYTDVEIKRPKVEIQVEKRTMETHFYICPACGNRATYNLFAKFVACPRCHISLEVKGAL